MVKFNMPPKNLQFLKWGAIVFCFYIFVLLLVAYGSFAQVDIWATNLSQALIPHFFDVPFSIFSLVGSFEIMALILAVLAGLYYRKTKKVPWSLILFGAVLVLEIVGKKFLPHVGPPPEFLRYNLPFGFPSGQVGFKYAFPSGHISRSFFVAIFALFLVTKFVSRKQMQKMLKLGIATMLMVMVVSRIYLGEHWLSDVIGGILLGSAMGLLALVYY